MPSRILILEDDPIFLSMCEKMLFKLGHIATTENTLEHIDFSSYDYVLTDFEMGNNSALDVLKLANDCPVVLMTAKQGFTKGEAAKLGFNNFLPKPFTMALLKEIFGETNLPNTIKEMFLDDLEGLRETLLIFKSSTQENIISLRQALLDNNFNYAQAICHKMLPMFSQLAISDAVIILKKVDSNRSAAYPFWQNDIKSLLDFLSFHFVV